MGLFGGGKKKREHEPPEPIDIPRDIDEIRGMVTSPTNVRMSHVREPARSDQPVWRESPEDEDYGGYDEPQMPPAPQPAQPTDAPLFVKIDRYRNIISTVGYLKNVIKLMKNSFTILKEVEIVREQTVKSMRETLSKIEQRVNSLDSDMVRPSGVSMEPAVRDQKDVYGVESTVADLRSQISQLKSDLQKI